MKTEAEIRDMLAQARHDVGEEMANYDHLAGDERRFSHLVDIAQARAVVATLLKVLGE